MIYVSGVTAKLKIKYYHPAFLNRTISSRKESMVWLGFFFNITGILTPGFTPALLQSVGYELLSQLNRTLW